MRFVHALFIAACSNAPARADAAPRVFVEASVMDTTRDDWLVASPNLIATNGVTASIRVGDVALVVTPEVLAQDELRLEVTIDGTFTDVKTRDEQLVVITTSPTTFVLLRPTVVRDDEDLHRVYERMRRERS